MCYNLLVFVINGSVHVYMFCTVAEVYQCRMYCHLDGDDYSSDIVYNIYCRRKEDYISSNPPLILTNYKRVLNHALH